MAFWNRKKKKKEKTEEKTKDKLDANIEKYGYKNYMDDEIIEGVVKYYQQTYSEEALAAAVPEFIVVINKIYKKLEDVYPDKKEYEIAKGIVEDGFGRLNWNVRNTNLTQGGGKSLFTDDQIKTEIDLDFGLAVFAAFDTRTDEEKKKDLMKAAQMLKDMNKK